MSYTASGIPYRFSLQGIVDIEPKQGPMQGGTLLTVTGGDLSLKLGIWDQIC